MLHGRDAERAAIGALLEGARSSRSAALVIRGEAGAGKSALLDDTADRAEDMHVLRARGVESESDLPFAAVQGLLRPALDRVAALPAPQARALGTALGLADGPPPERFLVYTACLGLLSELADRRPVLCLVDDAHWLDTASEEALTFVARRLDAEGIILLFGAREGEERHFPGEGVDSLMLDGLDDEAAHALVAEAAAGASAAVRERLVEYARGNALALVEMPAAMSTGQLAGSEPLPDALPMTRQLEAAFISRISRLPPATGTLLLVAAADDSQDAAVVGRAAADLGAGDDALDAAERSGLLQVRGTRIGFRHPLVRSAVYGAATSGEQRAAHLALAAALADDGARADRRAWHLAAGAIGEDEAALRELEAAARRSEERGGHHAAARAWARAAELTPGGPERAERLAHAARDLSVVGRDAEALAMADRAGHHTDAALRADLARVRVAAAERNGDPSEALPEIVAAAVALSRDDPDRAVELLMVGTSSAWRTADAGLVAAISDALAAVPSDRLSATYAVLAGAVRGFVATITGDSATAARQLRPVMAWGMTAGDAQHVAWASRAAVWLGDPQAYDALLTRAAELARQRGELAVLAEALGMLSVHRAVFAQRYDAAAMSAEEARALCRELGPGNLDARWGAALAVVAAVRGDPGRARELAGPIVEATQGRLPLVASPAVYALALADMGEGRWEEASRRLDATALPSDPAAVVMAPDRVEAAVLGGRPDEARDALATWEARAATTPAGARRLAGLRALMTDGDEATRLFGEALDAHDGTRPFDHARVRLQFGRHLRRQGQRVAAREQLRGSLEGFESLGAEPWAERARRELRASGETARRRTPDAPATLTPQEAQIAGLVAQGLTNKEVAAQLYLSPRTIDAHLRGVFAKLGITSRRDLRHLMRDDALPQGAGAG
ncbi:MAG: AAA family ATPase [Thermoleophilia bacterium]